MRAGDGEDRERVGLELTGTVLSFNEVRGFGWIAPDQPPGLPAQEDCFVHWSRIMGTGFRRLLPGQRVKFLKAPGRNPGNGPQATRVVVLDDETSDVA